MGWFNGFHGLISVNPMGVITGFAFSGANEKDWLLAQTLLALRRFPKPDLPTLGRYTQAFYLTDNGFKGVPNAHRWNEWYGAMVIAVPAFSNADLWPKSWFLWLKGLRQMVETVYDKLENWFGLVGIAIMIYLAFTSVSPPKWPSITS